VSWRAERHGGAEEWRAFPVILRIAKTVAAGVLLLASISCSSIEPPKVMLTGVEVEGLSVEGLELTLLADVRNPNDFGATIGKLDYWVFVDGTRLAEGVLSDDVELDAGEAAEVAIPFTLTWQGVGEAVEKALDGREHDWRLKGSATLRKGVLSKTFRFDEGGSFRSPEKDDVDIDL
jgi:LEA14-like dessication related protein